VRRRGGLALLKSDCNSQNQSAHLYTIARRGTIVARGRSLGGKVDQIVVVGDVASP